MWVLGECGCMYMHKGMFMIVDVHIYIYVFVLNILIYRCIYIIYIYLHLYLNIYIHIYFRIFRIKQNLALYTDVCSHNFYNDCIASQEEPPNVTEMAETRAKDATCRHCRLRCLWACFDVMGHV